MKRIPAVASVLVGVWALPGQAGGPTKSDQIEFKFPYQPGQVSRSKVTVTNVGSVEMPGPIPDQKFSQTIEQVWVERCEKVNPDNSAVFESGIERIGYKMSVGGMNIEFDSETFDPQKAPDPFVRLTGRIMSAMTGVKTTMTVGPDGRPVKFEGLKEAVDKAIAEIDEEANAGPAKDLIEKMRGMFDDDFMMQNMEGVYRLIPPNNKARVGDKWKHEWGLELPIFGGSCQGQGEYELVSIQTFRGRKCAQVSSKESYRMVPRSESNKKDPASSAKSTKSFFDNMHFEMASSGGKGIAYWDYQNGELIQLRQTDSLTIKVLIKSDPDAEDQQLKQGFGPIVQKIRNSLSVELLEETEAAGRKAKGSPATAVTPTGVAR